MSLGFDIDGCMNNLHDEMRLVLKRDYHLDTPDDEYELLDFFDQNQKLEFFEKNDKKLLLDIDPEKDVSEIIKAIKELGRETFIITARFYFQADLTIKWLEKNNIIYDDIYFNCGDKLDVCKWKNIKIMVEDKPDTAMFLAENGIKVLLFDRPYNKDVSHLNVTRCFNWKDIFRSILRYYLKTYSK